MHVRAENFGDIHCLLLDKLAARNGAKTHFTEINLDIATEHLNGPNGSVKLTPFEFQVLWLVIRTQETLISVDEIYYFLYEDKEGDMPISNTVEVMIARIRAKLETVSNNVVLNNDHGFGYRIETRV